MTTSILANERVSQTGRTWVRKNGKLSYDYNLIQVGGQQRCAPKILLNTPKTGLTSSRCIFQGYYEFITPVAIERILKNPQTDTEIEKAYRILHELDIHENFIRYFSYETDNNNNIVFIATELCLCSVDELFQTETSNKNIPKQEILKSLTGKEILLQATRGLDYLHQNNFVHRNVKPSSFLIKEFRTRNGTRYTIKIADFQLKRVLDTRKDLSGNVASYDGNGDDGHGGWEAPETRMKNQPLRQSSDVFILGCFYHYVLTGIDDERPRHPFGDNEFDRLRSIQNSGTEAYKMDWKPQEIRDHDATRLIKLMIQFFEFNRPSLITVLGDSYFKQSKKGYYPIYEQPIPGLCVIFNQEAFSKMEEDGIESDSSRLQSTFTKLGFAVVTHHNLMSFDLKAEMKKLASKDFSQYGCLVVCILSHGIENDISGSDGICVNFNKLKYKFSYNYCPSLYGKPKIFIIQACQGELKQQQASIINQSSNMSLPGNKPIKIESDVILVAEKNRIECIPSRLKALTNDKALIMNPLIMDSISIKASLPSFFITQNSTTESYFIKSLCQILEEEYINKDISKFEDLRDLEEILRGENGVQYIIDKCILRKSRRPTVSWEASLTKYIRFIKTRNEQKLKRSLDDGIIDQTFKRIHTFHASQEKDKVGSYPNQSN